MPTDATGPTLLARTFLFTDIEGSTARWEHQSEAMSLALLRHDAILRGAIERHGGQVFKTVGDSFCAVFASARDGLDAALDAQRGLLALDWRAFGPDFEPLRARMGLHTGSAEARAGDYFGPALNRTARLMSAGHGGQVLLSSATATALEGHLPSGLHLRDLGEHRLRDLRHSERISQVVAPDVPDVTRALVTAGRLGPRDRILVRDPADREAEAVAEERLVVRRTEAETLQALRSVILGEAPSVVVTPEQLRAAAASRPRSLADYRLARIAEWSQPRYRLDERFVALTLLVDKGEEAAGERWAAKAERCDNLATLLAAEDAPALVVLGPPGSGKSTLLRRLELDTAIRILRSDDADGTVTFFIQLNQYAPEAPGDRLLAPGEWLARRWSTRFPSLPPLAALVEEGRTLLLLDALNEIPAASEREMHQRVHLWRRWLEQVVTAHPGNRIVFSCRTLDYSASLSSPALRVPQVRLDPLTDEQVADFLRLYSPARWREIWRKLAGSRELEVLRSPYFLALLVEQVDASGEMPTGRAALFTGFVRQALRREVERANALFEPGLVLDRRDLKRIISWQWRTPCDLPERGMLVPKLADLAHRMQDRAADGERSQVRVDLDEALTLIDDWRSESIVAAGEALAVLDEDQATDELMYVHQLVQEYFAARVLAACPRPELVQVEWQAARVSPPVDQAVNGVAPGDTLPMLPRTGWEETTILAAAMTADAAAFVRGVMVTNLALAGQLAAQPDVRARLPGPLVDELRWALVTRSRDPRADLRDRIACGHALGDLGDPRYERREGPHGPFLVPPLVDISGGIYPIGDDDPIELRSERTTEHSTDTDHIPRHKVTIAPFRIGRFPVTNAEWACFMAAGGYDDERWWDTADARRWQQGHLADEGSRWNNRRWRRRFQADPQLFDRCVEQGMFGREAVVERWRGWLALDDEAFERALDAHWEPRRRTAPVFWTDDRYNRATQPVIGICWYEARAYCRWLAAQLGMPIRLPTEVEWEAAARGLAARAYPWGEAYDRLKTNTYETRLRCTTPVGVFPTGDTPEGVADLAGNANEWTSSLWGEWTSPASEVTYRYPYDAADGREASVAAPRIGRVVRGGAWTSCHGETRAAYRNINLPVDARDNNAMRVAAAYPAQADGGTADI